MASIWSDKAWRSPKYEDIYHKGYADGGEANARIGEYFAFHNELF